MHAFTMLLNKQPVRKAPLIKVYQGKNLLFAESDPCYTIHTFTVNMNLFSMAFYKDFIYAYLVDKLGNPPPIRKIRQQLMPLAEGKVLEIGAGSGANFIHYDATRVTKLYALEPNPGMIRLAERQKHRTKLRIEFLGLPGEHIPLSNSSVDTVVSTFTFCTIPDITEALKGIIRVLKPDGKLIFFELGLSPDANVQRWQKVLEPIHHWLFQGLYLTRDIPALIREAGFQIQQIEMGYVAQFPKSSSYCWWGIARPTLKQLHQSLHQ